MSFTYRYRKIIIISIIIITILSLGGFYIYKEFIPKNKTSKKTLVLGEKKEKTKKISTKKTEKEENYYKVDIKGEVINPGIYSLKVGSRVSDVINLAGGLTDIGDTTVINLSKKITDEMVIIIYSIYEVSEWEKTLEKEKALIENCKNGYSIENNACIENNEVTNNQGNNKVSLNTATKEELMTLSGIGEAKAESIIKYRDDHGGFTDINELKDINGIGDSIFDKIKDNITL